MKFGIREITDVVFKATAGGQKLGSKTYNQYDPILFFDSAKTSTVESAVATVYAQGGRGNPRLLAWDGDKTVTFTFEDALISQASFAALSGADLISTGNIRLHLTEKANVVAGTTSNTGKVVISGFAGSSSMPEALQTATYVKVLELDADGEIVSVVSLSGATIDFLNQELKIDNIANLEAGDSVLVDFYVEQAGQQLQVSAGKFGGYYYIEANTLFRGSNGKDYPAQFTIPKAKVQSNFTFTMASTGDPSTFNFTMDAFPAVTRFGTEKVLFSLEVSDSPSDVI